MKAFHEKYFLRSVREHRETTFLALEQGSIIVAQYEARFTQLVRVGSTTCHHDSSHRPSTERLCRVSGPCEACREGLRRLCKGPGAEEETTTF